VIATVWINPNARNKLGQVFAIVASIYKTLNTFAAATFERAHKRFSTSESERPATSSAVIFIEFITSAP
jgi:hypothetical protein